MTAPTANPIEALKLFNEFQSQSRARGEATLKLALIISSGMLTLSVGAVLNKTPIHIPANAICILAWAWGFLFYSMAAALLCMLTMTLATFHIGERWRKKMQAEEGMHFVATWTWLRIFNAALGISVVLACILGVALTATVAMRVLTNLNAI